MSGAHPLADGESVGRRGEAPTADAWWKELIPLASDRVAEEPGGVWTVPAWQRGTEDITRPSAGPAGATAFAPLHFLCMAFYVRYFHPGDGRRSPTFDGIPVSIGWHTEYFVSEHEAIERGCELVEHGIGIIKVAPVAGDPLEGVFIPLDAASLKRHRECRLRS